MNLGVFTVSMPDYEPIQTLEKLHELGYDGLEWRVCEDTGDTAKPTFWSGNRCSMSARDILRRAEELKSKAKELGLEMPSLGAYIDCGNLDQVEEHFQAAAVLGAANVRVSPGGYDRAHGVPYPRQVESARRQYAQVAQLARRHGVRAVIETHMGQLGPTCAKARAILEGLDPATVGIMWDPGNQVWEGSEVYPMAIEIAGEYLAEVHVKNMRYVSAAQERGQTLWQAQACPVHQGVVHWPQVIDALEKANYQGWLFFEDFSQDQPLLERLRHNLNWFRELTGKARP